MSTVVLVPWTTAEKSEGGTQWGWYGALISALRAVDANYGSVNIAFLSPAQ